MTLPDVAAGQPHVTAHNDERHKINEHEAKFDNYATIAGVADVSIDSLSSPGDVLANESPFWWDTEPVAVDGRVYAGTVSVDAHVYVQEWSQANENGPYYLKRYEMGTVRTPGGTDDHPVPGLAAKVGRPLIAFWSAHNMDNVMFWRTTTQNIEDIEPGQAVWGPVNRFEIPPSENTSYTQVMLHGDDIFLLHRTGDLNRWSLTKFANWATGTKTRVEVFSSADQFYVKGRLVGDSVRCIISDHPTLGTDNQVWYAEINLLTGSITKADGTVLGNLDGTNLPLAEASLDLVFTASGSEKPWTFDVGFDATTREIAFVSGKTDAMFSTTAHYYYGVYTAGAWATHSMVLIGKFDPSHTGTGGYFPSIVFDPSPKGSLVLAREASGTDYVERWVTANNGTSWTTTVLDTAAWASDTTLTRAFTVHAIDANDPLFDVMATEIDRYDNYTGPWVSRFRPLPRSARIKRLEDAPRTNLVTARTDAGPSSAAVYLNGVSGSYIKGGTTSPPSTGLSIEVDVALDNWASGTVQTLVAKEQDSTHREVCMYVNSDGKIGFAWSNDGSTRNAALPNPIPGFAPGQRVKLLLQFSPTWQSVADIHMNVYYRYTDDDPWITLSQSQVPPSSSLFSSLAPWEIGSRFLGTTDRATGKFYRVQIRSYGGSTLTTEWRADNPGAGGWAVQGSTSVLPAYTATWNGTSPLKVGTYYVWMDAAARLRVKGGVPSSDFDGVQVGETITNGAALDSAVNAINTVGKHQAQQVFCTTHAEPHWTNSSSATAVWSDALLTTKHTPV